jgi:ATP-dependent DNA helicase DinG
MLCSIGDEGAVMSDILNLCSADVCEEYREAIAEAGGNEVLAIGIMNDDGLVDRIRILARGHEVAVPILRSRVEEGNVIFHNHPSGRLRPSDADLAIAHEFGELGIGFVIVNNDVDEYYAVIEPLKARILEPLQLDELEEVLGPEGRLAEIFENYEERPSQIAMMRLAALAFNEGSLALCEAGTGVGKSLAYLIPALKWIEQNKERVVVSTATINLQSQLLDKDIPLAKEVLKSKVKAVMVKGRGNYLCLRRLQEAGDEAELFDDDLENISKIRNWAQNTKTGDREDLPFFAKDQLWYRVNSEADTCTGQRCSLKENCFLIRARREAADAGLLVTNHHLLFSDLAIRNEGLGYENTAILPPFQKIIFDEAHNIEASASSYFSQEYYRGRLQRLMFRMYGNKGDKTTGLLVRLQKFAMEKDPFAPVPELSKNVQLAIDQLEHSFAALLDERKTWRFDASQEHELVEAVLTAMQSLGTELQDFNRLAKRLLKNLEDDASEEQAYIEAKSIARRLDEIADTLLQFRKFQEYPSRVFWLEKRSGRDLYFYARITPLHIGPLMEEAVFDPHSTIVFTSATLSIAGDFTYWKDRVGLSSQEIKEGFFPSPFDYKQRVLLGIPEHQLLPNQEEFKTFVKQIVGRITLLAEGKSLVLFTSYKLLNEVNEHIRPYLQEQGITVLKQGEDERSRLLARFQSIHNSVLLATDSFWEGVDAPGDTLKVVILVKLPFKVPDEPVLEARSLAIEREGGSSFFQLQLPEAVMKFRQGFGRLMRRSSDYGAVIVLDPRVLIKSYGKIFLRSLPETKLFTGSARSLLDSLEDFLYSSHLDNG